MNNVSRLKRRKREKVKKIILNIIFAFIFFAICIIKHTIVIANSQERNDFSCISQTNYQPTNSIKTKIDNVVNSSPNNTSINVENLGIDNTTSKTNVLENLDTEENCIISNEVQENDIDVLDTLDETELYYLSHCVEIEAEGEGLNGKIAVANVLINRKNSNKFPNSFKGIVSEKVGETYQFSSYNSPNFTSKKISIETLEAIREALNGKNLVGNATYFCNVEICNSSWFENSLKKVTKIGNHTFYESN